MLIVVYLKIFSCTIVTTLAKNVNVESRGRVS